MFKVIDVEQVKTIAKVEMNQIPEDVGQGERGDLTFTSRESVLIDIWLSFERLSLLVAKMHCMPGLIGQSNDS